MKRKVSGIMLTLLLASTIFLAVEIKPARAESVSSLNETLGNVTPSSVQPQTCALEAAIKQNPMGTVYGTNGPLAGAYVLAQPSAPGGKGSGFAVTDSSGQYTMTSGLIAGFYNVTAFALGYLTKEADFVNVTAGVTTGGVNFELRASGEISGNVTDAVNGNAINGTTVYATLSNGTGTFGWSGSTGTDGKYVLDTNLPTGVYNVSTIAPAGYVQNMATANVTAGFETVNVNFQLARSGILSGKVVAPNGTGLSGISVFADSSDFAYYGLATTNSSGNYRIVSGLATANYTVFASGDGNYTIYGGFSTPISVPITAGQETSGIDIELTPAPPTSGTINGRLTNQNGNPIGGASVSATGTNGSGSGSTDSNGYYNITSGLGSGVDYNVSATASGYFDTYYPTLVTVTAGHATSNINIQMAAIPPQDFGTITGTITASGYSSTSVVCSPNVASVGSYVNCTATVSGSNPTGSITWTSSSGTGNFTPPVCALSSGNCSTTYTDNNTGYVTITAIYGGDPNNLPSNGTTTLTVFVNVTAGTNVTITPTNNLELTFANVTAVGYAVVNATPTVNAPALNNTGGQYYTVTVTAGFVGNVTVSIAFDGSNMTEQQKTNLRMVQYTPMPGDVRQPYGQVDMRDIGFIARQFGTTTASPSWDPTADITGPTPGVADGKVDMRDVGLASRHFGNTAIWVELTTNVDTANNVVYGSTTHFSFISIH